MNFLRHSIFLFAAAGLYSCASGPSDQFKDAFSKINQSLEKSGKTNNDSVQMLYGKLLQFPVSDTQAQNALRIYAKGTAAINYMDSIKQVLEKYRANDINAVNTLLISSGTAERLHKRLNDLYQDCMHSVKSYRQEMISELLGSLDEKNLFAPWVDIYFNNMPPMVVITNLNMYINNCKRAMLVVMKRAAFTPDHR